MRWVFFYGTLSRIVGTCIFNGTVKTLSDWDIYTEEFDEMVMTDYIISSNGAKFLNVHIMEKCMFDILKGEYNGQV